MLLWLAMEINITLEKGFGDCLDAGWLQEIAAAALSAEKAADNAEMGIVIAGQQQVQQLNRDYRNIDRPTDVLSFPMQEGDDPDFASPPDGISHLGDVIISCPQAEKQAKEHGHTLKKEMATLIIHGVLHLLGYDHIEDEEAETMESREKQILQDIMEKTE